MPLEVLITAIDRIARDVTMFTLAAANGSPLAASAPGNHIRLHLPEGRERCYSLVQAPGVTSYQIAVASRPDGAGGSRYLCEQAQVGQRIEIAGPFDAFALVENAPRSIFIAGGIGITPVWSMIQRLEQLKRPWQLHYAMRGRETGAFAQTLNALDQNREPRVHLAVAEGGHGVRLDIDAIVERAGPADHLYCCGPERMLAHFRAAAAQRDPATVHWEYFELPIIADANAAPSGEYTLELRRSERTIVVAPGASALDALLAAGIDVPYGCRQGMCGSCEIGVLDGTPDHRDLVLSDEERAANRTMMPCCSGCIGERLVIDL